MMWIIAGIIILLLLYRRFSETTSVTILDKWKEWIKGSWGKWLGWVIFVLIVLDLIRKFIFPYVPLEWKEWIPGFTWNTFEILAAIAGVVILWKKRRKKPQGTTPCGSSGIVVTDIPYAHNPPPVMYNGVPQVKWISSTAESLWNAVAIPIVILAVLAGVIYASNKMPGLINFWKWTTIPAHFPAWLMVLFVTNAIMAFVHKSNCFPILALGIFCSIVGYNAFPDIKMTVPAIAVVLPAVILSCYTLWKSDFSDSRIPGAFLVLLIIALY